MNSPALARIDLLRHGEPRGGPRYRGVTDDPLTATGWRQMWAAVENGPSWQRIVTSPLARCADFARALARRRSIPLSVDARLREIDFGPWEGRTAAELLRTDAGALRRFWRDPWNHPTPGGESLQQMQERLLAAWRDLAGARTRLLVITHGGPIRMLLCHLRDLAAETPASVEVPYAALYSFVISHRGAASARPPGP